MTSPPVQLVAHLRAHVLDAELAALLWLLAERGVPIHIVAADEAVDSLTAALRSAAPESTVTTGRGTELEDVLRLPVPLRPATGAVIVLRDGRVAAAHFLRPPLRDAGGHVRPQGPGVLATWDERLTAWEHFAWGITPELAAAADVKAGDFEIEHGRRRVALEELLGVPH